MVYLGIPNWKAGLLALTIGTCNSNKPISGQLISKRGTAKFFKWKETLLWLIENSVRPKMFPNIQEVAWRILILVWEWNGFRSSIIKHFNACTRVRPSFKIVKSECFERQLKMGPFPEFIVDWKIPLEIPFFFFFSFSRLQRKRIWRDLNFKGLNWKRQFNNVKPNQPFEAKTVSKKGR